MELESFSLWPVLENCLSQASTQFQKVRSWCCGSVELFIVPLSKSCLFRHENIYHTLCWRRGKVSLLGSHKLQRILRINIYLDLFSQVVAYIGFLKEPNVTGYILGPCIMVAG